MLINYFLYWIWMLIRSFKLNMVMVQKRTWMQAHSFHEQVSSVKPKIQRQKSKSQKQVTWDRQRKEEEQINNTGSTEGPDNRHRSTGDEWIDRQTDREANMELMTGLKKNLN